MAIREVFISKKRFDMTLSQEFLEDLEFLNLFNLESSQEGIKIHHEAAPARIASAKRLYEKHFITLEDGGYLTTLGMEAASHAAALITMLQGD
jgi:uncharacterized protein (TIGR02647 family)